MQNCDCVKNTYQQQEHRADSLYGPSAVTAAAVHWQETAAAAAADDAAAAVA